MEWASRIWPSSSCMRALRIPWRTPGIPVVMAAPPAASTATSADDVVVGEPGEDAGRIGTPAGAGHHHVGVGPVEQRRGTAPGPRRR